MAHATAQHERVFPTQFADAVRLNPSAGSGQATRERSRSANGRGKDRRNRLYLPARPLVPSLPVDHVDERLAVEVTPQVFAEQLDPAGLLHICADRGVRGNEYVR